jgi:predicted amidophosphoribosyltransferase
LSRVDQKGPEFDPEPKPDADKCPDCGGWINETAPGEGFCSKCGASFETDDAERHRLDPSKPGPAAVLTCPKCGAANQADADSLYCDQCGATLKGVPAVRARPGELPDERPSDGVCPDCGGPVVEIEADEGLCRRCGAKLVTPQVRSRRRWGFLIALIAAAIYFLFFSRL